MSIEYDNNEPYNILDIGFNKDLTKGKTSSVEDDTTPEMRNVITGGIVPKTLVSGEILSILEQNTGVLFNGKTGFNNTQTGYRLGVDTEDELVKFYIGNSTQYLNWTGTALLIKGALSASSIDIPDTTSANSFHVDSSGNTWWGATTFATAPASVSKAGVIFATSLLATSLAVTGTDVTFDLTGGFVFQTGGSFVYDITGGWSVVIGGHVTFDIDDGTGNGFTVAAGSGTAGGGTGGNIEIDAGAGGTTNGNGGQIFIDGGDGTVTNGDGGSISLGGGDSRGTGTAGQIYIAAGGNVGGLGTNGNITLVGSATNLISSAIINLTATSSIKLKNTGTIYALLSTASLASSDKTFTFPNATGTFALQGLAGTKVYYVSDTNGGAVDRKLTFTDGILTSET